MEHRNRNIEDLISDDSFIRWINEEADLPEAEKWDEWIRQDPANVTTFNRAVELYRSLRFREEESGAMQELVKLQQSVYQFESARIASSRKKSYYPLLFSIAAVLLLTTLFIYKNSRITEPANITQEREFTEVATTYGQLQKINFPDGSIVTLNANSVLKYSTPFLAGDAEIHLEGEAYFSIEPSEIENGTKRRVSIYTTDGVVNILGTSFNVNTRNRATTIVLDQGEVEVLSRLESGGSETERYLMMPGELAIFSNRGDKIKVQKVRTELYTSWRDLKWIFDDTPLTEIAERIESTYGQKVIINDESTAQMRFTGTAPNQNLSVLLESLRVLLDSPVEESSETITIGY